MDVFPSYAVEMEKKPVNLSALWGLNSIFTSPWLFE